jgi:hypothetical protein
VYDNQEEYGYALTFDVNNTGLKQDSITFFGSGAYCGDIIGEINEQRR